jgi:hypothetical protein
VDGAAYIGDQINPAGLHPGTLQDSSLIFHKYRPGAPVTVYYDPRAPGRAALETDPYLPVMAALTSGLVLLYIAARMVI